MSTITRHRFNGMMKFVGGNHPTGWKNAIIHFVTDAEGLKWMVNLYLKVNASKVYRTYQIYSNQLKLKLNRICIEDQNGEGVHFKIEDGVKGQAGVVVNKINSHLVQFPSSLPSPPRNLAMVLMVEEPPSIKVTWQPPRETFGGVKNYRVTWGPKGEHYETEIFSSDQYSFITPTLDKGTTYKFRVSAMNDVDNGERAVGELKTPDGVSSPTSRFDSEKFSPAPDPELICTVCMNVLDQPLETPCRHVFCGCCIKKAVQENQKCPNCRSRVRVTSLRPVVPLVQNIINKLTLKCNNFSIGCKELIKLEVYLGHISTCDFEIVCCDNIGCNERIQRRNLESHKTSCQDREVKCTHGCDLMLKIMEMESHQCVTELKKRCKELSDANEALKNENLTLKEQIRELDTGHLTSTSSWPTTRMIGRGESSRGDNRHFSDTLDNTGQVEAAEDILSRTWIVDSDSEDEPFLLGQALGRVYNSPFPQPSTSRAPQLDNIPNRIMRPHRPVCGRQTIGLPLPPKRRRTDDSIRSIQYGDIIPIGEPVLLPDGSRTIFHPNGNGIQRLERPNDEQDDEQQDRSTDVEESGAGASRRSARLQGQTAPPVEMEDVPRVSLSRLIDQLAAEDDL